MPDPLSAHAIRRTAFFRAIAILGAIYAIILLGLSGRGISASIDELLSAVDTWQNGEWLPRNMPKEQDDFWRSVADAGDRIKQQLSKPPCATKASTDGHVTGPAALPTTSASRGEQPPNLKLGVDFRNESAKEGAAGWAGMREGHNVAYPVNYGFATYITQKKYPHNDCNKCPDNKPVTPDDTAHVQRDICRYKETAEYLHGKWGNKFHMGTNVSDNNPHCRRMAEILGINCKTFPDLDLGVSWVYVASTTGSYMIYPGNEEIIDQKYDPRIRPWYLSAVDKDPWSGGANKAKSERLYFKEDAGVTVPYRDYSDELGDVRTYWQKVAIDGDTYVIGIDFLLFGDREQDKAALLKHIKASLWQRALNVFLKSSAWSLAGTLAVGLLVAAVFRFNWTAISYMLAIGQTSTEHEIVLTRQSASFAGNESVVLSKVENQAEKSTLLKSLKAWLTVLFAPLGRWGAGAEATKTTSTERSTTSSLEQTRTLLGTPGLQRGIEVWKRHELSYVAGVSRSTGAVVRVLDKISPADLFIVEHTPSEPNVRPLEISIPSLKAVEQRVCEQLGEFVVLGPTKSLPAQFSLDQPLPTVAIPKQVLQLKEVQALRRQERELRGSRFKFQDSVAVIRQLYRDCRVRATCRCEYLEMLLKEDALEVLETGEDVSRLIIFKDEKQKNKLSKEHAEKLTELFNRLGTVRQVYLDKVDINHSRSYDFAIVKDSTENELVAVTAADTHKWDEQVRGYISWRTADVAHYSRIYEALNAATEEL